MRCKRSKRMVLVLGLIAAWCGSVTAERVLPADQLDQEFELASELIRMGLPDYAEFVVDRVVSQFPEQAVRGDVVRAEALVAQRRFEAAEQLLAGMQGETAKVQAVRLALADGYYRVGRLDECRALYEAFFSQYRDALPTDPDLLRFYRTAAHKYAQMLAGKDAFAEAAAIYTTLLRVIEERDLRRQVLLEQAELLLKAAPALEAAARRQALDQAESNCAEILWNGMDIWFGRALTCLAQSMALRGDREGGAHLLEVNLDVLETLDAALDENGLPLSESPVAGARMLLGDMRREDGDRLLGPAAAREAKALEWLERGLAAYRTRWGLIVRAHRNDEELVRRHGGDKSVLQGTAAERREPFRVFDAHLEDLVRLVGELRPAAWTAEAAARAGAFDKALAAFRQEVAAYPRDIGVTPRHEFDSASRFPGDADVQQARALLAGEGERQQAAVAAYLGALQQYYNVFAAYGGSAWSEEAGRKVEALKARLNGLTGQEVEVRARGKGEAQLARLAIREADDLMERGAFDKAAGRYLDALEREPEGADAMVALANLIESYAKLGDSLRVRMLARYIGERFHDRAEAAQVLLRMGRFYYDRKEAGMADELYETYLSLFPDHSTAPTILYMLGEERWKQEDRAGAVPYYERLVKAYPRSAVYLNALSRLGWAEYLAGRYEPAAATFRRLVDEAPHGREKAEAQLCLADALRQGGDFAGAVREYRDLVKWLQDDSLVYRRNASLAAALQELQEQAVFFQAYCLSRVEAPGDKEALYRQAAVKLYRQFVERFPNSRLAPTAMSSLGAVLLAADKADEAAEVYRELSRRYPDSEQGQNARFAMVRSLVEVGQSIKAVAVLDEMIAEANAYSADQFLRLGELFAAREEPEAAVRAYRAAMARAAGQPEAGAVEQRALFGIGAAGVAAGRYEEAAEAIDRLLTAYPRTGFFFDARFLLADAWQQQGQPQRGIEALKDVFERAQDQVVLNRATLRLARLQVEAGQPEAALASTQRIVLLADPKEKDMAPVLEEAMALGIRLLGEQERWTDVMEQCNRYQDLYPAGAHINDVRQWRSRAAVAGAVGGADAG
jgi:TolA-binding protein